MYTYTGNTADDHFQPPDYLNLNAFNLTPGITFITDEPLTDDNRSGLAVWVTMTVGRSITSERVFVWARRADEVIDGPGQSVQNRSFDFAYCDQIAVVGNVINYLDPDDNDWGN